MQAVTHAGAHYTCPNKNEYTFIYVHEKSKAGISAAMGRNGMQINILHVNVAYIPLPCTIYQD